MSEKFVIEVNVRDAIDESMEAAGYAAGSRMIAPEEVFFNTSGIDTVAIVFDVQPNMLKEEE